MIRGLFISDTWFIRAVDFERLKVDSCEDGSLLRFHTITFVACSAKTVAQLIDLADDHWKTTQKPMPKEKAIAFVKFTEGLPLGVTNV